MLELISLDHQSDALNVGEVLELFNCYYIFAYGG